MKEWFKYLIHYQFHNPKGTSYIETDTMVLHIEEITSADDITFTEYEIAEKTGYTGVQILAFSRIG